MTIRTDSPLRRVPDSLPQIQATFLDGIRYGVDMLDLAYIRLADNLLHLALRDKDKAGTDVGPGLAAAFLDAWSIVDCLHRLRAMFKQMPGLKQKTTPYQIFVRTSGAALGLRNAIQHLDKELAQLASEGAAVYGAINWLAIIDTSPVKIRSCLIIPGRMQSGEFPIENPLGKEYKGQVDHITLRYRSTRYLNLSEAFRSIQPLIAMIEKCLDDQFGGAPTQAADGFTYMESVCASSLAVESSSTKD